MLLSNAFCCLLFKGTTRQLSSLKAQHTRVLEAFVAQAGASASCPDSRRSPRHGCLCRGQTVVDSS